LVARSDFAYTYTCEIEVDFSVGTGKTVSLFVNYRLMFVEER
jgi:hypothetical protein